MKARLEQSVRVALESAFTVVVTTRVGRCEVSLDEQGDFYAEPTAEGVVAQTTIDIARGDVFHTFDPEFITGEARELRAFHEKAVGDAMQLPALRLTVLKEVAELLGKDLRDVMRGASRKA